ncbi:MAG: endonuclease MutS2 [Armatimonadota bacterium]|nr:endonuclease MutS2 [bacterium]
MEQHTLKVLEFEKIISKLQSQAACALGREVAGLSYPTTHLDVAVRKLQETSEARSILQYEGNIPFGGIEDVRHHVERASVEALLQPSDLLSILNTLHGTARLGHFMRKLREKYPILADLGAEIELFEPIERAISGSIAQSGDVLDSASAALARARSELRTTQSRLTEKMNSYLQSGSYKTIIQEPVITIRSDRYCIPIKSDHRGQFPGIVHDASASGATLFIEPAAVVELGNKRKQLVVKEREEVEKVLAALTACVAQDSTRILATLNVVGMIDAIAARAKLSLDQDATAPLLNDHGKIELLSARHPLLEGDVVPIDMTLGGDFNALLVTGPNTGGKTVALKTVGLLTLMAACGMHVPAEPGTRLAIFENVYADIGDEQSIEQSLSTFSSHLNNIVRITNGATRNTLVLMDEVGAGTDPAEGAALAKAIVDFLLERGARIIATTHYGELKEYAYMRDGVENASVEFDPVSLRPTYRLMIGIPGSSNAFAIASRLGLNTSIIDSAQNSIAGHEVASDELIRRIEESHKIAAEQRRAAERNARDAEILRKRYEQQLGGIESVKSRVESKTKQRAENIIEAYSRKLENTLEQLAAQKADSRRAQDLKKKAEKLIDQLEEQTVKRVEVKEQKEEKLDRDAVLEPGTIVGIAGVNQNGEIVEPPEGGKVVVLMGAMRVSVPLSSLRKPHGKAEHEVVPQKIQESISLVKAREFESEIHLRGMRVEPALIDLDKYIDDAMAAGVDSVRIVHGKGTGQMRQAVWEYLRSHKGVKSYRLGEQDEGGSGVTIAQIKR